MNIDDTIKELKALREKLGGHVWIENEAGVLIAIEVGKDSEGEPVITIL